MLVIRNEQMRILRLGQLQRFEDDMTAHLIRRFAGKPVVEDADRLRAFVREGINHAGKYGIVSQFDVQRFLEFRAEYGADFHSIPWIAKVLNDSTLSGCGKMDRLDHVSLFAVRS